MSSIVNPARLVLASVLWAGLCSLGMTEAPVDRPSEYQVKAAYLFNFTKFVTWNSPPASSTFDVCIMGRDPFGRALDSVTEGEQVDGHKVVVRRVGSTEEAAACRVLFLSSSEEGRERTVLESLPHGMLTVSDIPRFVQHGGMIEFVREGDRIRFQVNLPAAENAGLTLSSELLKVAVRVNGAGSPQ